MAGTIPSNQELIISWRLGISNWNIMDTARHVHSCSRSQISSSSVENFGLQQCCFAGLCIPFLSSKCNSADLYPEFIFPSSDCFLPPHIIFKIEVSKNIVLTMVIVWWLICTSNEANSTFYIFFSYFNKWSCSQIKDVWSSYTW